MSQVIVVHGQEYGFTTDVENDIDRECGTCAFRNPENHIGPCMLDNPRVKSQITGGANCIVMAEGHYQPILSDFERRVVQRLAFAPATACQLAKMFKWSHNAMRNTLQRLEKVGKVVPGKWNRYELRRDPCPILSK